MLKTLLWRWVPTYEKRNDSEQILERYHTVIGEYLDEGFMEGMRKYTDAVSIGSDATDDIILQHLNDIGLTSVSARLQGTRRLLTYWRQIVVCKGGIRFLKYAYSYYGVSIADVEYATQGLRMDYGTLFDIGQPMDTSGLNTQKQCVLYLTGPVADLELKNTLVALAIWNQSPYITYEEIYYNDEPILNGIIVARIAGLTASPEVGFTEGELQIQYDETKVQFALVEGELYITVPGNTGLRIGNFTIDANGFLVYVN